MVALSDRSKRNKNIFRWIDVLVVRLVTPHVSNAVHTPSNVECKRVSHHGADHVTRNQTLRPEIPRNDRWYDETEEKNRGEIKPANANCKQRIVVYQTLELYFVKKIIHWVMGILYRNLLLQSSSCKCLWPVSGRRVNVVPRIN